ncbi:MAG TPA: 5-(carboxyamino)imidazole ribonucleotide mutase [Spirochaetia bacterium]|nr:5-(carboxyamino)imidazole ribonucleotide mutase [Spirochaetia bacterium]
MGNRGATENATPLVGIIMGSDSDLPVMANAADLLSEFEVAFEVTIVSAHRTPDRMYRYASAAADRGIEVIIAGAGGAAHLPGMVASMTVLPVIGVPMHTAALGGLDSLLSIVQMPTGIPVATVAIGNAANAALIAARILGIKHPEIRSAVSSYAARQREEVEKKAVEMERGGFRHYQGRKESSP